jgi:hypothetical protein
MGLDMSAFKKVIILDDLHLLIQTVLEGGGVSFLPLDLLGDHLAAGRVNAHFIPGFQHARQRNLVVNQGEGSPAALTQLLGIIFEHFCLSPNGAKLNIGTEPGGIASSRFLQQSAQDGGPACCLGPAYLHLRGTRIRLRPRASGLPRGTPLQHRAGTVGDRDPA